jgi:hypothetical protein
VRAGLQSILGAASGLRWPRLGLGLSLPRFPARSPSRLGLGFSLPRFPAWTPSRPQNGPRLGLRPGKELRPPAFPSMGQAAPSFLRSVRQQAEKSSPSRAGVSSCGQSRAWPTQHLSWASFSARLAGIRRCQPEFQAQGLIQVSTKKSTVYIYEPA